MELASGEETGKGKGCEWKLNQAHLNVSIEGNIGSGKTSFLQCFNPNGDTAVNVELRQKGLFNLDIIPEPLEKWKDVQGTNLLRLMYQEPSKYTFQFQIYVMLTNVKRQFPVQHPPRIRMIERLMGSECFIRHAREKGMLSKTEVDILSKYSDFFKKEFHFDEYQIGSDPDISVPLVINKPDVVIYLDTKPEICLERIKSRNREEEFQVKLPYLKEIHEIHEFYMDELEAQGVDIIKIDNNCELGDPSLEQAKSAVIEYMHNKVTSDHHPNGARD